jgi:VWFA-related protein
MTLDARTRFSRAFVVVGLLSLVAVQVPRGQVHTGEQVPTFRVQTDVVQLDVSVLDRQGQPVHGLQQRDFTVLRDGRPQSVVAFASIDVPNWTSGTATWFRETGPDVASNRIDTRRAVVVLMDDVNPTPADDRMIPLAKSIANSAIDGLGPMDLAAVVFALNRGRGQEFTLDRTRLRAAVDRFIPPADSLPESPFSASRPGRASMSTRVSLPSGACLFKDCVAEALTTVGQILGTWPGARKTVVLISAGRQPVGIEETVAEADERRQMIRALQNANVTVYQFDPHGLQTSAPALTDFGTFAESTGGRAVTNSNAPAGAVADMYRENSSYYLLGLPADDNRDGRFHRLQVRVNRPDVQVRTRAGYFASPKKPAKVVQTSSVERALSGGLPAGDLPVSVSVTPFAAAGKPGAALAVVARLDHDSGLDGESVVELVTAAFNDSWKQVASATQRFVLRPSGEGARFSEAAARLNVPPGRYEVRTAMRNTADDRTGSVYASVTVPNFERESLSLSGLVVERPLGGAALPAELAGIVPARMTTTRQFSTDQRAAVVARVYQLRAKAIAPVRVSARIVDGSDRVAFTSETRVQPTAFNAQRQADYRLELPLAHLADGEYLLTVEANVEAHATSRTLRFSVRR